MSTEINDKEVIFRMAQSLMNEIRSQMAVTKIAVVLLVLGLVAGVVAGYCVGFITYQPQSVS